jgi:hypothetical protein
MYCDKLFELVRRLQCACDLHVTQSNHKRIETNFKIPFLSAFLILLIAYPDMQISSRSHLVLQTL